MSSEDIVPQIASSDVTGLHCTNTVWLIVDIVETNDQNLYSRTRDITFFILHILLPFENVPLTVSEQFDE